MSNSVNDYYELTKQPWGKIFYDLVWEQIDIENYQNLNILDYGSGFGITADHYSRDHQVIAIELSRLMLEKRYPSNYEQIVGGIEKTNKFPDGYFDVVICHNVLEYCQDKKDILDELIRVLKVKGRMSIVKHNKEGKVFQAAVFNVNPEKAMSYYQNDVHSSKTFGEAYLYSEKDLREWVTPKNIKVLEKYGVRTFFSLVQNNDIKYDSDWYLKMLNLEREVSKREPYKSVSFFNHYILVKE